MAFILLSFVLTGVVLGTFVNIENVFARVGNNLGDVIQDDSDLRMLQIIESIFNLRGRPPGQWLRDWISRLNYSINMDPSITSNEIRLQQALHTVDSARYTLISSLQEMGYAQLVSAARSALANIGAFEHATNKDLYIHNFLSYITIEDICRRMGLVCSPQVLNNAADEVSRWMIQDRNNDFDTFPLAFANLFDSQDTGYTIVKKVFRPIFNVLVPLLLAVMHAVDNDPWVKATMEHFLDDPTSLRQYTSIQENTGISVREVMNDIHSRITPLGNTSPASSNWSRITELISRLRSRGNSSFNNGRAGVEDVEAQGGIPESLLFDEEMNYCAAVLVVMLMKLHAEF